MTRFWSTFGGFTAARTADDEGDRGFDQRVLADMMGTLDRFDDEIPVRSADMTAGRAFFATWANGPTLG